MVMNHRHDEHQRLVRDSSSFDENSSEHELDDLDIEEAYKPRHRRIISLSSASPWRLGGHSKWPRLARRLISIVGILLTAYIFLTPLLLPSYVHRPKHYSGTNPNNEKVFIAANIVDEKLIRGAWGQQIVDLVELLGEDNVYLSIYENDSGEGTKSALQELKARVKCKDLSRILAHPYRRVNRQILGSVRSH
jgi:hypothetical protein